MRTHGHRKGNITHQDLLGGGVDTSNTGRVLASDAAAFLKKSGLPDLILGKIWDLADTDGKGILNKQLNFEFPLEAYFFFSWSAVVWSRLTATSASRVQRWGFTMLARLLLNLTSSDPPTSASQKFWDYRHEPLHLAQIFKLTFE
ncbi:Epidermal growth factor receptor substrate 15 [Plecturocebus cupreus]